MHSNSHSFPSLLRSTTTLTITLAISMATIITTTLTFSTTTVINSTIAIITTFTILTPPIIRRLLQHCIFMHL
jgi:hypothetical protein